MDTPTHYNVIFNGTVREGFERKTVAATLAQKLHLDNDKVKRLFDGADHTIKRTASREEAQQVVLKLAQLGAVARVDPPIAESESRPAPALQQTDNSLPPFTPLKNGGLFKPLLYLAVAAEILFAGIYLWVLFALGYYTFFNLWAAPNSEYPLLILMVQLLLVPALTLLLLLLAKPLLSLRSRPYRGILVHEEQEPDLQMFVEDVCERLGVPAPQEIRFNNDTALLVHHRGLAGFWRNEYLLTIGVPLLAALKTNQLAALLSREMLCFHPRSAPRAGFLLMATNRWLHVALHREDMLDLALKRWLESGRLSASTVERLQKLFNFTHRLMQPRQALSRILERRLVHHIVAMADEEAFAMAGREGLSQALEQQRLIAHTAEDLIPRLYKQWDEKGVLPDDMVQLIVLRARQFPATIHPQLRLAQERQKAAENDLIPADAQRINRLDMEQGTPGYACVSPALTLVRYFAKLATTMTVRYYHNRLNLPITPNKLIHPLVKGSTEEQLHSALNEYFNGVLHLMQPLNLQHLSDSIRRKEEAVAQWRAAMTRIKADLAQARRDYSVNATTEKQLIDNSMREALYRAELWRKMGESKPRKNDFETFLQQCRDTENESEQVLKKVAVHQQFYAHRLAASLFLLRPPEEEEDSDRRYMEIVMLLSVYSRIESILPKLRELKLTTSLLNILLSYLNSDRASALKDRIDESAADIRQIITSIKLAMKDVPNPFPAPRGGKGLMDYLLLESFSEATAEGDFDRGNDIVNRMALVQQKILARLIEFASEAEQGIA